MGAHPAGVHPKGLLILAALVAVSAVGFSFYNQLLRYHPVGQIAIYNAFIPVLGVVLSCLLLGEPFSWRYLLSGALVTVGICAVNLPAKARIDS
jgi:drug/metabolite transporter (DMT)-like permease